MNNYQKLSQTGHISNSVMGRKQYLETISKSNSLNLVSINQKFPLSKNFGLTDVIIYVT